MFRAKKDNLFSFHEILLHRADVFILYLCCMWHIPMTFIKNSHFADVERESTL